VVDYLQTVKTFLDNNPNEILTFIFTNPDGLSVTDIWKPAFDNAGTSTRADFQSRCVMTARQASRLWLTFPHTSQ